MPTDLRTVKTFPQLLRYLRDELLWPIESNDAEELSFEYAPADFAALAPEHHVQIDKILQLRPLVTGQPWGIFYVQFKKARLPVVVLRELLASLVFKKRASANKSEKPAWECHDLLFISSYGEEGNQRHLNFAHFSDSPNGSDLPALRVLDWDEDDTDRALQRLDSTLHERLRWPEDDTNLDRWREQWSAAFRRGLRHPIKKAEQLALALAVLAKNIRVSVLKQMEVESERGKLRILHAAFKSALIHDLEPKQFADMFAQTIAYGLFTQATRRTVAGGGTSVTADGTVESITSLSPFLRELLNEFLNIGGRRRSGLDYDKLGVNEVVDLLNSKETDLAAVLDDFGHKKRDDDPVIYFYEGFAKEYDPIDKIKRGEFYTPTPAVSYIVRSVHELLQTGFGLPHGLASTETWGDMLKQLPSLALPNLSDDPDPKKVRLLPATEFFVQVLDPASGTATFLVETIDLIHRHLKKMWEEKGGLGAMPEIHAKPAGSKPPRTFPDYWQLYVPTSLLPRLYAFELKMAPYAIAHMKIALKLADTGFTAWNNLGPDDRVNIYLTNSLEPKRKQLPQVGFEALAHEAEAVNFVKWNKRFTVIIGNPPYAVNSANKNSPIDIHLDVYKQQLDDEKNLKPLNNDYVKFFRFAQMLVRNTGVGIIGEITSHSYTTARLFRSMRKSLLQDFHQVRFIDLRGETSRDPLMRLDQNVFDITQGVGIGLFLRQCDETLLPHEVQCFELIGARDEKYHWLSSNTSSTTKWDHHLPRPSLYSFRAVSVSIEAEYNTFLPVNHLFDVGNVGYQTHRDEFVIDIKRNRLVERINAFRDNQDDEITLCKTFGVKSNSDWSAQSARISLRKESDVGKLLQETLCRPFDVRHVYYAPYMIDRDRRDVMRHMISGNIALLVSKVFDEHEFTSVFVTRLITESKAADRTRGSYLFPLRIAGECGQLQFEAKNKPALATNLRPNKVALFAESLGYHLNQSEPAAQTAELTDLAVFNYLYAVLHSPTYRARYAESLKTGFPRIPIPGSCALFEALVLLGSELVALHLLEAPQLDTPCTKFLGSSKSAIESVSYTDDTVYIDKAQTTGFAGVPEAVFNFHVGGYQVCERWLKERKGHTLSKDDVAHYHKILSALTETIRLMQEIDNVIAEHGGFPAAFAAVAATDQAGATATAAKSAPASDLGLQTEDELPLG